MDVLLLRTAILAALLDGSAALPLGVLIVWLGFDLRLRFLPSLPLSRRFLDALHRAGTRMMPDPCCRAASADRRIVTLSRVSESLSCNNLRQFSSTHGLFGRGFVSPCICYSSRMRNYTFAPSRVSRTANYRWLCPAVGLVGRKTC